MAQLDEAMAQFFCEIWNEWIHSPIEALEEIIAGSPLVEQRTATEADVEAGDLPDGCELGDPYYALSALGLEAWALVYDDPEPDLPDAA